MSRHSLKWDIRAPIDSDYEQWSALYRGYREFYQQVPSEDVIRRVWSWIQNPNHETQGLVAVSEDGILGGLAHHRRFVRPLSGTTGLYLDDLFTRPDLRGSGIATCLIDALSDIARKEGLSVVRWTTREDNMTARRLYDSVASATQWVTYDKVPGSGEVSHGVGLTAHE